MQNQCMTSARYGKRRAAQPSRSSLGEARSQGRRIASALCCAVQAPGTVASATTSATGESTPSSDTSLRVCARPWRHNEACVKFRWRLQRRSASLRRLLDFRKANATRRIDSCRHVHAGSKLAITAAVYAKSPMTLRVGQTGETETSVRPFRATKILRAVGIGYAFPWDTMIGPIALLTRIAIGIRSAPGPAARSLASIARGAHVGRAAISVRGAFVVRRGRGRGVGRTNEAARLRTSETVSVGPAAVRRQGGRWGWRRTRCGGDRFGRAGDWSRERRSRRTTRS